MKKGHLTNKLETTVPSLNQTMSSSNSIMSEKKSLANIQSSKSFPGEQHKSMMSEEREIQTSPKEHVNCEEEQIISVTVSVFRVPKALSETKPEAYAPRKLGLGAFHHFRRDLYPMRCKKLDHVIEFMAADEEKGPGNICSVLNCLVKLKRVIRGSYAESLNLNKSALKKVIATDGIYLLNWLHGHDREDTDAETMKVIRGDILMLENQIPGYLILEIWNILKPNEETVLSGNIRAFCEQESPLQLEKNPDDVLLSFLKNGHLLNVLYNLILQRESETYRSLTREITIGEDKGKEKIRDKVHINFGKARRAETSGGGTKKDNKKGQSNSAAPGESPEVDFVGLVDEVSEADIIHKGLSILQKLPLRQFLNELRSIDPDREENTAPVEEIKIPSASKLSRNAGIRFELCTKKGIRNVKFDKTKRTLYLPAITLTSHSEVILRNLLAYEAAITKPRSRLEFAEYVDLMCGIVDKADDVNILCEANIIAGDLKPTKIASIFNGIWRSTGDGDEQKESSDIGVAIKGVNEFYGSRLKVRMWRFIHRHIFVSYKLLAVVSSAVALTLLALHAFCDIYDCNKHWFGGTNYDPSRSFDRVGRSFSFM